MSKDEWYRRKTWTPSDRTDFLARLERSRGDFQKAQYARIQAWHLQEIGTDEATQGAVELLEMILSKWREDAQLAMVCLQHAQCLLVLGQQDRAINAFREAFRAQRAKPSEHTDAHLDFGWLCISAPLPQLYQEALCLLDEFQGPGVFPINTFREAAIRALIHDARKEHEAAREHAQRALSAATQTHSAFRRHSELGLVKAPDPEIIAKLQLIGGTSQDQARTDTAAKTTSTAWENVALIAGIGALVGTGVLLFTLLNDWRLDQLKTVADYLRLAGVIVLPFLLVLLICARRPRLAKRPTQ